MSEQKDINQPKIEKFIIESNNYGEVDLSGVFVEFSIFENIMNDYTILEIEMKEHINLIETLPINGGEKIKIRFKTEDSFEQYESEFYVYKISNISSGKQKEKKYTIHAISKTFFNDKKYRISRRFNDKPDVIVDNICTNIMDINLEDKTETKYKQDFVVPNWSPLQTINYLTRVSLQNDNSSSLFFFYQAKNNFYFKSLGSLFSQDVPKKKTFKWQMDVVNSEEKKFTKIKDLEVLKDHDVFKNYFNGVFGSTLHQYDLIHKSFENKEETYDSFIEQTEQLNSNPIEQDIETNPKQFVSSETNVYNNKYISDWYQIFIHEQGKFRTAQTLMLTVPGNSNVKIGDTIRVEMPSTKPSNEQELDPYLSGKYLVSKVRHQVAKENYNTILEVIKESNI